VHKELGGKCAAILIGRGRLRGGKEGHENGL